MSFNRGTLNAMTLSNNSLASVSFNFTNSFKYSSTFAARKLSSVSRSLIMANSAFTCAMGTACFSITSIGIRTPSLSAPGARAMTFAYPYHLQKLHNTYPFFWLLPQYDLGGATDAYLFDTQALRLRRPYPQA